MSKEEKSSDGDVFVPGYLLAGKGNDLAKRLMRAASILEKIDQDVPPKGLDVIAASLVDDKILKSNVLEVQQLATMCLCDLLRIYAPDAPYNPSQLFTIFGLVIKTLGHLKPVEGKEVVFERAFYVLKSLAVVRSSLILCEFASSEDRDDEEQAQELLSNLFDVLISSTDSTTSRNVAEKGLEIIESVLDELTTIPLSLLEVLLSPLLRPSTEATFEFALTAIRRSAPKLKDAIAEFIRQLLRCETPSDATENGFTRFQRREEALHVAVQLSGASMALLDPILPLISADLHDSNDSKRAAAVITMGQLFALPPAPISSSSANTSSDISSSQKDISLAELHRGVYLEWVARFRDKFEGIRNQLCVLAGAVLQQHAPRALAHHPALSSPTSVGSAAKKAGLPTFIPSKVLQEVVLPLLAALQGRLEDPVESVRMNAVSALCDALNLPIGCALFLEYSSFVLNVPADLKEKNSTSPASLGSPAKISASNTLGGSLVASLIARSTDKSVGIRREAITGLAQAFAIHVIPIVLRAFERADSISLRNSTEYSDFFDVPKEETIATSKKTKKSSDSATSSATHYLMSVEFTPAEYLVLNLLRSVPLAVLRTQQHSESELQLRSIQLLDHVLLPESLTVEQRARALVLVHALTISPIAGAGPSFGRLFGGFSHQGSAVNVKNRGKKTKSIHLSSKTLRSDTFSKAFLSSTSLPNSSAGNTAVAGSSSSTSGSGISNVPSSVKKSPKPLGEDVKEGDPFALHLQHRLVAQTLVRALCRVRAQWKAAAPSSKANNTSKTATKKSASSNVSATNMNDNESNSESKRLEQQLFAIIDRLAEYMPNRTRAVSSLRHLAENGEFRVFHRLNQLASDSISLADVRTAREDILTIIKTYSDTASGTSEVEKGIADTLRVIVRRVGMLTITSDMVPHVLAAASALSGSVLSNGSEGVDISSHFVGFDISFYDEPMSALRLLTQVAFYYPAFLSNSSASTISTSNSGSNKSTFDSIARLIEKVCSMGSSEAAYLLLQVIRHSPRLLSHLTDSDSSLVSEPESDLKQKTKKLKSERKADIETNGGNEWNPTVFLTFLRRLALFAEPLVARRAVQALVAIGSFGDGDGHFQRLHLPSSLSRLLPLTIDPTSSSNNTSTGPAASGSSAFVKMSEAAAEALISLICALVDTRVLCVSNPYLSSMLSSLRALAGEVPLLLSAAERLFQAQPACPLVTRLLSRIENNCGTLSSTGKDDISSAVSAEGPMHRLLQDLLDSSPLDDAIEYDRRGYYAEILCEVAGIGFLESSAGQKRSRSSLSGSPAGNNTTIHEPTSNDEFRLQEFIVSRELVVRSQALSLAAALPMGLLRRSLALSSSISALDPPNIQYLRKSFFIADFMEKTALSEYKQSVSQQCAAAALKLGKAATALGVRVLQSGGDLSSARAQPLLAIQNGSFVHPNSSSSSNPNSNNSNEDEEEHDVDEDEEESRLGDSEAAPLRLAALQTVLRTCAAGGGLLDAAAAPGPLWHAVSLSAIDAEDSVRKGFLSMLERLLLNPTSTSSTDGKSGSVSLSVSSLCAFPKNLPFRWLPFPALFAADPVSSIRRRARALEQAACLAYARAAVQARSRGDIKASLQLQPEFSLPYLLFLLSHDQRRLPSERIAEKFFSSLTEGHHNTFDDFNIANGEDSKDKESGSGEKEKGKDKEKEKKEKERKEKQREKNPFLFVSSSLLVMSECVLHAAPVASGVDTTNSGSSASQKVVVEALSLLLTIHNRLRLVRDGLHPEKESPWFNRINDLFFFVLKTKIRDQKSLNSYPGAIPIPTSLFARR